MPISTKRLYLRPFTPDDAPSIYQYAKNPKIGPIAGWPVHTSVANSRQLIEQYLMQATIYAVTLKDNPDEAIGSVGLEIVNKGGGKFFMGANDAEIGYWIGEPFWGQGLIPEAAAAVIKDGFTTLGLSNIWCGYYDGNRQSKRVQMKLGFKPELTIDEMYNPILDDIRKEHFTKLKRTEWLRQNDQ